MHSEQSPDLQPGAETSAAPAPQLPTAAKERSVVIDWAFLIASMSLIYAIGYWLSP